MSLLNADTENMFARSEQREKVNMIVLAIVTPAVFAVSFRTVMLAWIILIMVVSFFFDSPKTRAHAIVETAVISYLFFALIAWILLIIFRNK